MADLTALDVEDLRPINNHWASIVGDAVVMLDLEVVAMHQVELQEDPNKASEVEVPTLGGVSSLAGHNS